MNTSLEPDRRIEAFLEDGPVELPDRAYDAVRSQIDSTRQRVVIGPWRTPDMNLFSKLPIVLAAVVVAAVVGIGFLPLASDPTGVPAASSSPSPPPDPFASQGPLDVGTYRAELDGVPFTFDVPAEGWESGDFWVMKGDEEQPEEAYVVFWSTGFDNVYADPCAHTPLDPAPEASAAGIAKAISKIPGTDLVTGPWSVTVGDRPAQHVVFTVREDIGCEPNEFYLWYDDETGGPLGGYRYADSLGQTMRTWIVELDDHIFWVDSQTAAGADAVLSQEIQQIVESLQFE